MKPVARREGLLIRELPDEVLVYDREDHRAHCLNRTAATVFRHADGTRTVAELARLLAPGAAGPATEDVVTLALALLAEAGLLEGEVAAAAPAAGLTRRDLARRAGLAAAILLPAVASMVAPTPAEAAATCVTTCLNNQGKLCSSWGPGTCTTDTCTTNLAGSCSDGGGA